MLRLDATRLAAPLCLALFACPVAAQTLTIELQGRLANVGGAVVADGKYTFEVSLYASEGAADPLHAEVHTGVDVKGSVFALAIGTSEAAPLDPAVLTEGQAQWVGVAVQGEPELPRRALHFIPYAARALNAVALECSGCVTISHLAPSVVSSLGQIAGLAALAGDNEFVGTNRFGGAVGFMADPVAGCAVNLAAPASVCAAGAPARLVLDVADDAAMTGVATPGQVVYRTDKDLGFIFMGGAWRQLAVVPECGDGKPEFPEECDEGDANADSPDTCRVACVLPTCGDDIKDSGEECDDGEANEDAPDSCRTNCSLPTCGDAIRDAGELCDGPDLGGADCGSIVSGSEGTLVCKPGCQEMDFSQCEVPITHITIAVRFLRPAG